MTFWSRRWISGTGGRWAALGTLAAGALLVAFISLDLAPGPGDRVPLFRVEKERFVREVRAEGYLEAVRATPILVPSEVRRPYQIAWLAEEGQLVEAGETVLRFDPTELERTAEDAYAGFRTTELKITQRSTTAGAEGRNLERDALLAGAELETVRSFPRRDELIFSRNEVIEGEINEELAAGRRWHAEKSRETSRELAATELDLLAIERQKTRRELERTEKALGLLEITAPHAGILVIERDWHGSPLRAGNTVFSGQKVAEIPDLSAMKAEVFVLEADAGGLEVGQTAEVVVESNPETVHKARITRVDTLAKPRLEGSPVQFFGATLELERTDPRTMKPGQRVLAAVRIAELEDVLVVPRQAVVSREDGHFVFRKVPGGFEQVAVTLGASGLGRTVVASGLSQGEVIAARDPGWGIERLAAAATEAGGVASTSATVSGGQ